MTPTMPELEVTRECEDSGHACGERPGAVRSDEHLAPVDPVGGDAEERERDDRHHLGGADDAHHPVGEFVSS